MLKDSFNNSKHTPNTFFGDYQKRLKEEREKADTNKPLWARTSPLPSFPTSGSSDTSTETKSNTNSTNNTISSAKAASDTVRQIGSEIKSKVKSVLSKKYGELDTRHLFDDIDDKDIEDNIETAENAIKTNIDRGTLSKSTLPKLPNLRDGLALSYAAANKGNSKAATKAREAAYMEDEPLVKKTDKKLLYNNLPKSDSSGITNAVSKGTEQSKMTTLIGDPNKKSGFSLLSNRSNENPPKTGVRFKAATSGNTTTNKIEPDIDSIAKKILPENSMAAELQRREKAKNSQKLNPPSTITPEFLRQKSKEFSYKTSEGTEITPSNDVMKYLEEYFNSNYNTGKTTVDVVINDVQLEALHKYLTNGIKNMERPANIGVGAWNKQVQTDLKWIDDMFGQSSNFAKALKTLPAITIGIDTVRGISENIKNDAGWKETVSDVIVDISVGGLEAGTATALMAGATYLVPALAAGGIPGLIVGVVAGLAANYLWDYEKYGGDKTIKERLDSLF